MTQLGIFLINYVSETHRYSLPMEDPVVPYCIRIQYIFIKTGILKN